MERLGRSREPTIIRRRRLRGTTTMSHGPWTSALASLVVVRVAIPLVALAAAGKDLPGLPRYNYRPLIGDATGFYAESRELISVSFGPAGVAALLLLGAGAVAVRRLRRSWAAIPAACLAVSLAASALVLDQQTSGAAVVGWPLLWSIPLFPFRATGILDEDLAFAVGLVLSLGANAVTVVATAYIGLRATGNRAVGVAAAAVFTVWPLLMHPLAGASAWENGQWLVDVGLALYTEPLSTAFVTAAIALLLTPALDPVRLASAGALLGFATVVRPSNGLFAAAAVMLLVLRIGIRKTVPAAMAGLAFAPLVAVYWPKGYPTIENVPGFSFAQADRSWTESLLFNPRTVLVLAPLALLGFLAVSRWNAALLGAVIATNVALYTFYEHTHLHPRFLYVTLPALFALEAAGAWLVIRKAFEARHGRGL
jgi:hypothetical protein